MNLKRSWSQPSQEAGFTLWTGARSASTSNNLALTLGVRRGQHRIHAVSDAVRMELVRLGQPRPSLAATADQDGVALAREAERITGHRRQLGSALSPFERPAQVGL